MAKKKSKVLFKNMLAYRLPKDWLLSATDLAEQLARHKFHPCGSQEEHSRGFIQPRGTEHDPLVYNVAGQFLIALQEQKRLLPSSVVNEAVLEKAAKLEEQQGFAPGRKQLKELKEETRQELLPKAFLKTSLTRAWVNPAEGWLVVDAGSLGKGDTMLEALGLALDEFPARRLQTTYTPETAMTEWLTSGEGPDNFSIDRDCELRSPVEEKPAVRYVRHTLEGEEVRNHLAAGKRPTRLSLTFDGRLSFTLTEKGELKGLKLLDIGEDTDADNADDLFDAELTLMAGEYTRLLNGMVEALGGEVEVAPS